MAYLPRIVDAELDELLADVPAIAIDGPKAVGKTETALQRARTVHNLDDDETVRLFEAAPSRLVEGEPPILIDEWQRLPQSWDVVRRAVDSDPSPGKFLLTGSAAPSVAPAHSGAGRIVTVRMRPMSLVERQVDDVTVSLGALLTGDRPEIRGETSVGLQQYIREIVGSGFPGIRGASGRSLRARLNGYIDRIVEREFPDAGSVVRDPGALRRWMAAYAAASSTATSFEKVRDAASAGEGRKPSRTATEPYRRTLEQIWMIDATLAWLPTRNHLRRLGASPVHQLADPALAARLLDVDDGDLLSADGAGANADVQLLGALFESLVTLSVKTYAQANESKVSHLRTHRGAQEVDLIVEGRRGKVVAIEVKLTASPRDEDVRHLAWLAERIGDDLLDAVIVTTGKYAYRRPDGIAVVPAALLGP